MMPLKIRRYPLALAAFFLLSFVPTIAEVVNLLSMLKCCKFLLDETVPQVPGILKDGDIQNKERYKLICQTFKNDPKFLTLYDTENKIPVFSAYKYSGEQDKGRPNNIAWKIEPQLEKKDGDENMIEEKTKQPHKQAWDDDYKNKAGEKRLNRGHLFPSSHASTNADKVSTFTLTNIVPQNELFNGGSWSNMEQCIKCVMDTYCKDNNKIEGFVVTGAQPGTKEPLNNRVNIPSMLWSAFCCYSKEKKWIASAHWGNNDKPKDIHLQTKTLKELNEKLKTDKSEFNVFPTKCPLDTTVSSLYESLPKDCNCPQ